MYIIIIYNIYINVLYILIYNSIPFLRLALCNRYNYIIYKEFYISLEQTFLIIHSWNIPVYKLVV